MAQSQADSRNENTSRRNFLKASSAVAAGTMVGGLAIPRNAYAAGDDVIKIGVIGCGGRGTGATADALNTTKQHGPMKLVAMADAFDDNVQHRYKALASRYPDLVDVPPERRFSGLDAYKKVLDTDCDLVILATPPGFRPIHFEAAVRAGKHVFMEKPVATDGAGVRQVLAANEVAKQKNLAVAVGLQRRHEDAYKQTITRVRDGAIGDILLTRVYWNGGGVWVRPRKPGQSEMAYQVQNWYYFNWLCGDHITEQHIHNLDVSNWLLDAYPVRANGLGGREVRKGPDYGQIYDHHFVEFTYANGSKMNSQCRHIRGCWNSVSEFADGTKGSVDLSGTIRDRQGKEIWSYGRGGGGGHQQEHFDLHADLRAGRIPNEGDYGAKSTMTSILGRLATYSGQEITWDDALNSEITLGIRDFASFDETPPVTPDADGRYPVPVPGDRRQPVV